MIRRMAAKEFLNSINSLRFVVVTLICCLLMPMSVWVLSSDYLREVEDYQSRVSLEEKRQAGKENSIGVSRPVPQLSALFRGISLDAVNAVDLKFQLGWNQPHAVATQSDTHAVFPSVDLTFIISFILSAMALVLSFDAISGEKVAATLRLVMAGSVPRNSLVIGKWVGLSATIFIPFVMGIVISLLLFINITGVNITWTNWVSLFMALLSILVFLSTFLLLGITISASTSSPAKSIYICLAVWGVLTMLIPQMALSASEWINPVPTAQEKEKNIRMAHNEFCDKVRNDNIALSNRALREGWSDSRVSRAHRANEINLAVEALHSMNSREDEFWKQIARQEGLGKLFTLLSPSGSLNLALVALADTGPESQREFLTAAYRYGERFFDILGHDSSYRSTAEVIADIPKFQFEETSLSARFSLAILPVSFLLFLNVLLFFVAVIAFNRYDVR